MIDSTTMEFFGDNPEPCLAGTLCLMSLYGDNPCTIIAHKIIQNLYVLGHQSVFSEPFRNVLRELYEDWLRRLGVDSSLLNLNLETATSH